MSASFIYPLRVRWAEVDQQKVVFNPHYLAYADLGFTEYLRHLTGGDAQLLAQWFDSFYVVKSTVEFKASAHFDEQLSVSVSPSDIGRSSLTVNFDLHRDHDQLWLNRVVNVYVHTHNGRSSALPADLRRLLEKQ